MADESSNVIRYEIPSYRFEYLRELEFYGIVTRIVVLKTQLTRILIPILHWKKCLGNVKKNFRLNITHKIYRKSL